jgi:hypothetical protein
MTTTFEAAPYRDYTQGDINALDEVLGANEIKVLHSVQKWDRFSKGGLGCFAKVATIARDAHLTPGQTRNIISRLHKKGFIAFLGMYGKYMVRRRVVILGGLNTKPKGVDIVDAEEILNTGKPFDRSGHVSVKAVTRVAVPTVEEIRAECSFFLTRVETDLSHLSSENETRMGSDEKYKDNPPSAGVSFSSSSSQTPEVNCPESTDDLPAKPSHKKKDWMGMVETQPFIDLLKKRFPGYSDIEARLLMNLMTRKGVAPAVVGFVLENLGYVPREAGFQQPARPTTLASFCRNFFSCQEIELREIGERGEHDNMCELAEYEAAPVTAVENSLRHLKSFKHLDAVTWTQDSVMRSYDLWPDLVYFSKTFGIVGHALKSLLPVHDQDRLLQKLGCYADGALEMCRQVGLDFETTFGWSYAHVIAEGAKRKALLIAERDHHGRPDCWTPNPIYKNQLAA